MAWISTVPAAGTIPLVSTTVSSSTYNEQGEKEWVSAGVVIYSFSWNQRFDTQEVTKTYELDGFTKEAANSWLEANPSTRTKDWELYLLNPEAEDSAHFIYLPYVKNEVVTTRSISQSSPAGSWKLSVTIVTQTTEPVEPEA